MTGGRDYFDDDRVRETIERLAREDPETTIVEGGASGADRACRVHALRCGLSVETYPADWSRGGRSGGPRRNQRMVDSGLDLLVAFPGGRETADMVRRARAAGIPVEEVRRD